jgi:hypothetical protein
MKRILLFLLFILFSAKAVAQYMPGLLADRLPPEPYQKTVRLDSHAVGQAGSPDLAIFFSIGFLSLGCLAFFMATALLTRIQTVSQLLRIFSMIVIVVAMRGTTVVTGI